MSIKTLSSFISDGSMFSSLSTRQDHRRVAEGDRKADTSEEITKEPEHADKNITQPKHRSPRKGKAQASNPDATLNKSENDAL